MKNFIKLLLIILVFYTQSSLALLYPHTQTESRYFCCNPRNTSICDGRSYAMNDRHSCFVGCPGTAKCVIKQVPVGINPTFAHDYSVLPLLHTHHYSNLNLPLPIVHNSLSPQHHYHYPDYANLGNPIRTNINFSATNKASSFEPISNNSVNP